MADQTKNYDEFAHILYNTFYDNHAELQYVKEQFVPLRDWIKNNIPEKLYRFRPITKYSISALETDEIWGSQINTFNDPFECLPSYHMDAVNRYIDHEFSVEIFKSNLKHVTSNNIPEWITTKFFPEIISNLRTAADFLLNNPETTVYLHQLKQSLISMWQENLDQLNTQFITDMLIRENMYAIASFSETYTSSVMWAHYAKSHTGFCIEYDIKSFLTDCSENCTNLRNCPGFMMNYAIAPVMYQNQRYDASAGFMSLLINWSIDKMKIPMSNHYFDMFLPTKLLLTKSSDWDYEREWRLFKILDSGNIVKHKMIANLKPTDVYVGVRIKEQNKRRIVNICNDKQIPCYQMLPQYFTSTYESTMLQIN